MWGAKRVPAEEGGQRGEGVHGGHVAGGVCRAAGNVDKVVSHQHELYLMSLRSFSLKSGY